MIAERPRGLRAALVRLSSGVEPHEVPPSSRSRLISIGVMMVVVSAVSAFGVFSLLISTGMGDTKGGFAAAIVIGVTLAAFIISFDRWIVTSVYARWDELEPLVAQGLHQAWQHRAAILRHEALRVAATRASADENRDDAPAEEVAGEMVDEDWPEDEDEDEGEDRVETEGAEPSAYVEDLGDPEADDVGEPAPEPLTESEQALLQRYEGLLVNAVVKRRRAILPRVIVTVPIALLVAHGVDLLLFDRELDRRAEAAALPDWRREVEAARGHFVEQQDELKRVNERRERRYNGALKDYRRADRRFRRASSFNGCPSPSSPGYENSVCQTQKERMVAATSARERYRDALSEDDFRPLAQARAELDHLRTEGLHEMADERRGVLADVGFLLDYLEDDAAARYTYLVIFFLLVAVDLSIVLLKITSMGDSWERHRASQSIAESITFGHKLAVEAVALPEQERATIATGDALRRRQIAVAYRKAERAEARLQKTRQRHAAERAERSLAIAEHDRAMRIIEHEEVVRQSMFERALARVMSVFPPPKTEARDGVGSETTSQPARRRPAARSASPRQDGEDGHRGVEAAAHLAARVRLEPVVEVLDANEGLRGNHQWVVVRRASVPGRTAAANGVYIVERALDNVQGFLKLYTLPEPSAPSTDSNELLRERAVNEIQVLEEINSDPTGAPPYLPRLLDRSQGGDERRTWTVTELCDAGDADRWGRGNELHLIDVLQLMTDVLRALETSQYVHGDIKPPNILVYRNTPRGMLFRLTDWETAHKPVDGTPPVVQQATPEFAAPERGAVPSPYDDLYALGATVWWLCTRRFVGELEEVVGQREQRTHTQPTEHLSDRRDEDLLWLAVHRYYRSRGCYELHELLPPHVPRSFSKLVDRLLGFPADTRANSSSRHVSAIAAGVKDQVAEIRHDVRDWEERHGRSLVVGGHKAERPPRRIVIDDDWRDHFRRGAAPGSRRAAPEAEPTLDGRGRGERRPRRDRRGEAVSSASGTPSEAEGNAARGASDRSPPAQATAQERSAPDDDVGSGRFARVVERALRSIRGRRYAEAPDEEGESGQEQFETSELERRQAEHDRARSLGGSARHVSDDHEGHEPDTP